MNKKCANNPKHRSVRYTMPDGRKLCDKCGDAETGPVAGRTQNETILKMLQNKQSVTALTAFYRAGSLRLSGRIMELRENHKIKTDMITVGKKRVASYTLVS